MQDRVGFTPGRWLSQPQTLEEIINSNTAPVSWICLGPWRRVLGASSNKKRILQDNFHYTHLTHFVALGTERNSSLACCPLLPGFPTPQIWGKIIRPSNRSFPIVSHGLLSLCYREPGSLWKTLLILARLTPRALIEKQVTWLICLRNHLCNEYNENILC